MRYVTFLFIGVLLGTQIGCASFLGNLKLTSMPKSDAFNTYFRDDPHYKTSNFYLDPGFADRKPVDDVIDVEVVVLSPLDQ